jgi:hypothetical protein
VELSILIQLVPCYDKIPGVEKKERKRNLSITLGIGPYQQK